MEPTVYERAWEKYPEVIKHHNLAQIDINEEKRKMYIEVATEQKQVDDEYWTGRLFEYTEDARERQAVLIEKSKVFIKDLLLSIIGCEPKEGWIENILNEYEKTLEE